MFLELVDEHFKKAVREEIAKVITKDTQNENKEYVQDVIKQALKEMWDTQQPAFEKAFKAAIGDASYGATSFRDKVVDAIKCNAQPLIAAIDADAIISKYIAEEMINNVVAAKVEKILNTRSSEDKLERIMEKKIQEIFIRKFMLNDIAKA